MKIDNISFPYPVLGIGDDVFPIPSMKYSLEADKFNYYVTIEFDMQNKGIAKLIKDGFAKYVCEVECATTYYRHGEPSKTPEMKITIPRTQVARTVTFQCTITVLKDIPHYKNKEFNEDYENMEFALTPGDILAYFGDFTIEADVQYDKLKSIDSMMTITRREGIEEPFFNLSKDKINIQLPPTMYDQYMKYGKKPMYSPIIHTSLVLNALTYALYNIDQDEYSNLLWARTIKVRLENEEKLKALGIDPFETNENLPRLAQAMLGNPYERMFDNLERINTLLSEEE